jgi:hypothetical protein
MVLVFKYWLGNVVSDLPGLRLELQGQRQQVLHFFNVFTTSTFCIIVISQIIF